MGGRNGRFNAGLSKSHITHHTSHITQHTSPIIHHTADITHNTSHGRRTVQVISFDTKHIFSRVDTVARSFVVSMRAELAAVSVGSEEQEEEQAEEAVAANSRGDDKGFESDGKSDDCTELAEEISEIVERVAASEFPPVLTSQQRCMDVSKEFEFMPTSSRARG